MKTISTLILTLLFGLGLFAQQMPADMSNGNPLPAAVRDNEFQCLPGAVFSQVFPTFDNGYYADDIHTWVKVTDDYTASQSFSNMRFWGTNYPSCDPVGTETFVIEFYNGNPCSGGALVHSFTKVVTPAGIGIINPWGSEEMYQVDVDFGTNISLLNGWVTVSRQNPGDGCYFAWLSYGSGNCKSIDGTGNCIENYAAVMFCLGGSLEPVPVSNWALFIGIGLILVFAVIRFRRIL